MRFSLCSVAAIFCSGPLFPAEPPVRFASPAYSASSIVNAASSATQAYAPGTILTLYGQNLAYDTASITALNGAYLPSRIGTSGVTVIAGGLPAGLFYVSPTQINFLLPSVLGNGNVNITVVRDGISGPTVRVSLAPASPGLFQVDPDYIVATHLDGSVVDASRPADPGEIVLLYATGLGGFARPLDDREVPNKAIWISSAGELRVLLNGATVSSDRVLYAGAAPGFAGLYQINLKLPEELPGDPEIRVAVANVGSKPGVKLHVRQH